MTLTLHFRETDNIMLVMCKYCEYSKFLVLKLIFRWFVKIFPETVRVLVLFYISVGIVVSKLKGLL